MKTSWHIQAQKGAIFLGLFLTAAAELVLEDERRRRMSFLFLRKVLHLVLSLDLCDSLRVTIRCLACGARLKHAQPHMSRLKVHVAFPIFNCLNR